MNLAYARASLNEAQRDYDRLSADPRRYWDDDVQAELFDATERLWAAREEANYYAMQGAQ